MKNKFELFQMNMLKIIRFDLIGISDLSAIIYFNFTIQWRNFGLQCSRENKTVGLSVVIFSTVRILSVSFKNVRVFTISGR